MKKIFLVLFVGFAVANISAQESLSLKESVSGAFNLYYPENVSNLSWVPNEYAYIYSELEEDDEAIYKVNLKSDKKERVIDTFSLSKKFKEKGVGPIGRFRRINWSDENQMIFAHAGSFWSYDLKENSLQSLSQIKSDGANHDPTADFSKVAYTIDNNLYYNQGTDDSKAITSNKEDVVSGQAIHRYEFGIAKGTFWSPEANYLAFYEKDESMVTDYALLDYSSSPGEVNPVKYPMAGQKSHQAKIGIYDTKKEKLIYIDTGVLDDHYLTNLTWSPDEKSIYVAEINRDQNHMMLNQYDVKSGKKIKTLFEEKDNEYVEPEHGPIFLPGLKDEFLWYSERDGFNHLYRYNMEGKLINRVTSGDVVMMDILDFQKSSGNLIISGTAKPTEVVAYQVNIDGGGMKRITSRPGKHSVQVSSNGKYIIDNYMALNTTREIDVMDVKGKAIKRIKKSFDPLERKTIGTTEVYPIKADDGTDLWCRMIKPSNFDAKKKYPVLVYVYGGPHAQMVTDSWLGGASLWMHYMAERGYIIFTLDNRGSANRGIEFEQSVFRNIGDQELKDQLTGVEHLKSLKYVNSDKMAIHGWSFGGFMTTSMMTRYPDVFKVGVAGGPVIDWSLYEVMYTERYMDTPETNPEGFKKAMVADYIPNLTGDLMLIHGSVDDVVVMQHSMKFLQRCVEEEKQVDFFVYPGHPHNVRGKDRVHLMTKVLDYIEDKLETK